MGIPQRDLNHSATLFHLVAALWSWLSGMESWATRATLQLHGLASRCGVSGGVAKPGLCYGLA